MLKEEIIILCVICGESNCELDKSEGFCWRNWLCIKLKNDLLENLKLKKDIWCGYFLLFVVVRFDCVFMVFNVSCCLSMLVS